MKNTCLNKTIILGSLLVLSSLFVPSALAQEATSVLKITAIPPRLEVEGKPGKVVTQTIKIRNESNTTQFINTSTKDIVVLDNSGTPTILENLPSGANRWAMADWIQVSPSQFKLAPGETKALVLTIIIPDDAVAGGHYAAILHTPNNQAVFNDQTGTGNSIISNVGTIVYLTIPGKIKQDARLKFTIPSFSEYGPVTITSLISNLSDIHIRPEGKLTITDLLGRSTIIPYNSVNSSGNVYNIFPNTTRKIESVFGGKWMFGRFSANLEASYGTSGQLLSATSYFWVFPVRLMLAVLTIILIFIGIYFILKKGQDPSYKVPTSTKSDPEGLEMLKKKYRG